MPKLASASIHISSFFIWRIHSPLSIVISRCRGHISNSCSWFQALIPISLEWYLSLCEVGQFIVRNGNICLVFVAIWLMESHSPCEIWLLRWRKWIEYFLQSQVQRRSWIKQNTFQNFGRAKTSEVAILRQPDFLGSLLQKSSHLQILESNVHAIEVEARSKI